MFSENLDLQFLNKLFEEVLGAKAFQTDNQ